MIAKNRAQLKAWIKNMSAKVDVNENIIAPVKERLCDTENKIKCPKCGSEK